MRWPWGLLALLSSLFPAQLAQFIRMFAGFFDADEMRHPASENLRLEPVPGTVFATAQTAPSPRFDVQRPVRTVCLFPRASASHSEILQCAKDPDVTRQRARGQCADSGRLLSTLTTLS